MVKPCSINKYKYVLMNVFVLDKYYIELYKKKKEQTFLKFYNIVYCFNNFCEH